MNKEKETGKWLPELDALVAAPQHHKLLFENEAVRVLDTLILPGEQTRVHTHQYPASLYIISWSDFIRYDPDGQVLADSKTMADSPEPGTALWSGPLLPHALKNTGENELHVISVEIKQPITH
ncbi:MAG TPA: hypothetical protein PLZ45_04180 [Ferruginibacter sp.]|nr:hypothetical protein [Chitinophagaceae bacterium]HRI23844.1 hypothetical protein [Ferruginibacter sp.]